MDNEELLRQMVQQQNRQINMLTIQLDRAEQLIARCNEQPEPRNMLQGIICNIKTQLAKLKPQCK